MTDPVGDLATRDQGHNPTGGQRRKGKTNCPGRDIERGDEVRQQDGPDPDVKPESNEGANHRAAMGG